MTFYPEDANGRMVQLWHGSKWLTDLSDEFLTPMVIHPRSGAHYYMGELSKCENGQWFIPQQWFNKTGNGIWALGVEVMQSEV